LDLPISGLYLLAAPKTPEAAIKDVVESAKGGQKLSLEEVKEYIGQYRSSSTRLSEPKAPPSPPESVPPDRLPKTTALEVKLAPDAPEQTAEERKAPYAADDEPDIPVFPDRCTATGTPALPLSVSAPPVAWPADALPSPAATSLPRQPGEPPSRKRSDPAFDLLCDSPGEMNLHQMINNLGARAIWQSMVTAFGIPAIYRVMTDDQKNEFSDLINAEVEAQNA
jgi:hypothetical protein